MSDITRRGDRTLQNRTHLIGWVKDEDREKLTAGMVEAALGEPDFWTIPGTDEDGPGLEARCWIAVVAGITLSVEERFGSWAIRGHNADALTAFGLIFGKPFGIESGTRR